MDKRVLVIIPAYNEEENIVRVVDNLINNLKLVIDNFYIKKYNITEEKISFIKEGREL